MPIFVLPDCTRCPAYIGLHTRPRQLSKDAAAAWAASQRARAREVESRWRALPEAGRGLGRTDFSPRRLGSLEEHAARVSGPERSSPTAAPARPVASVASVASVALTL